MEENCLWLSRKDKMIEFVSFRNRTWKRILCLCPNNFHMVLISQWYTDKDHSLGGSAYQHTYTLMSNFLQKCLLHPKEMWTNGHHFEWNIYLMNVHFLIFMILRHIWECLAVFPLLHMFQWFTVVDFLFFLNVTFRNEKPFLRILSWKHFSGLVISYTKHISSLLLFW